MYTQTNSNYPIHLRLLTVDIVEIAQKKLTASEHLIVLYINGLNPFCDRFVEIVPAAIAKLLDISRATFATEPWLGCKS